MLDNGPFPRGLHQFSVQIQIPVLDAAGRFFSERFFSGRQFLIADINMN
jgi:hypothetical protein